MIDMTVERKDLLPFETVAGRIEWQLEEQPRDFELRLCWFTRGSGAGESETVGALALGDTIRGERDFSFTLPGGPWSTGGRLIKIVWALEVVAKKRGGLALEELVVSPDRKVRELKEVAEPRGGRAIPGWLKRWAPGAK